MNPSADMSMLHLIAQASWAVKAVMLLLVAMSLWSWWMIGYKMLVLKRAAKDTEAFEDKFWSGGDLNDLYGYTKTNGDKNGPSAKIFEAGFREFVKQMRQPNGKDTGDKVAVLDATRRAMRVAISRELDRLERGLPGLATVASVSPYIGLFGTVWGIMNSFRGLASVGQATLAQVAPGIAEALIATAIGLFAAIPAVIAYNRFTTQAERLESRFETFAEEFQNILQRQA
jgi:biopolymer transport protein TolQ